VTRSDVPAMAPAALFARSHRQPRPKHLMCASCSSPLPRFLSTPADLHHRQHRMAERGAGRKASSLSLLDYRLSRSTQSCGASVAWVSIPCGCFGPTKCMRTIPSCPTTPSSLTRSSKAGTPLQVFDIVIRELARPGILVVLDNRNSNAEWCCGNDGNQLLADSQFRGRCHYRQPDGNHGILMASIPWSLIASLYAGVLVLLLLINNGKVRIFRSFEIRREYRNPDLLRLHARSVSLITASANQGGYVEHRGIQP